MNQAAWAIAVPIQGKQGLLLDLLGEIQSQVRDRKTRAADGALIPFADLETLHFARFAVLPPPRSGTPADEDPGPPMLLFATVHDGPRAQHLNELVTVAGHGLLRVFALCDKELEGQPRDRLREYLEENRDWVECASFWSGHQGRGLGQIRAESALRREIRAKLGRSSGRLSRDPFAEVVDLVHERADLRWALSPPAPTRLAGSRKALLWGVLALAAFLLGVTSPIWVPWLRFLEWRDARRERREAEDDPVDERRDERDRKRLLLEDEDLHVQNQMTAISDVKPGLLRSLAVRVVLWAVDILGRILWDDGTLNGIRTIHFARWLLLKRGGKLQVVFLSNYDGSWENYLGEFVDQARSGLTAVWSHTAGFPRTKWLIFAGARRELKFKRWVRSQQVKTQVWYSAYPDLSVVNVQNNSEIRRGLQGLRGLEERRAWLRRL